MLKCSNAKCSNAKCSNAKCSNAKCQLLVRMSYRYPKCSDQTSVRMQNWHSQSALVLNTAHATSMCSKCSILFSIAKCEMRNAMLLGLRLANVVWLSSIHSCLYVPAGNTSTTCSPTPSTRDFSARSRCAKYVDAHSKWPMPNAQMHKRINAQCQIPNA